MPRISSGPGLIRAAPTGDGVIDENRVLYAAFSEGDTSASGSVVCRFSLDDIDANFDTGFYVGPNQGQLQRTPPTCEAIGDLDSRDIYVSTLSVVSEIPK